MKVPVFQDLMDLNRLNQNMKKEKTMSKMTSTMSEGMRR